MQRCLAVPLQRAVAGELPQWPARSAIVKPMSISAKPSAAAARRDPAAIGAAVQALAARFGNRLVTSQAVREQHGNTVTWIENQPPDAVVYPQSTADVQDIV